MTIYAGFHTSLHLINNKDIFLVQKIIKKMWTFLINVHILIFMGTSINYFVKIYGFYLSGFLPFC